MLSLDNWLLWSIQLAVLSICLGEYTGRFLFDINEAILDYDL